MENFLFNLMFQLIAGGFTGYITNTYAVNMLFKSYTPLQLGGVIVKRKQEFIDNISRLIERDVLPKEVLLEIAKNPAFEKIFEAFMEEFTHVQYPEYMGKSTLQEIPGYHLLKRDLSEIAGKFTEENFYQILSWLDTGQALGNYLAKSTRPKMIKASQEIFSEALEDPAFQKRFGQGLRQASLYLEGFFQDANSLQALKKATSPFFERSIEIAAQSSWDSWAEPLEKTLQIDFLLKKMIADLFSELRGSDIGFSENGFFENPHLYVRKILYSQPFTAFLHSLLAQTLLLLQESDRRLSEIFSKNLPEDVQVFLLKMVQDLIKRLVRWLEDNKSELEALIEESIKEAIGSREGARANLLRILKDTALKDLAKRYQIVNALKDYLEEKLDADELASTLTTKLLEWFNQKTLRDLMILLTQEEKISVTKIADKLQSYASSHLDLLKKFFPDPDQPLEEVFPFSKLSLSSYTLLEKGWEQVRVYLQKSADLKKIVESIFDPKRTSAKVQAYVQSFSNSPMAADNTSQALLRMLQNRLCGEELKNSVGDWFKPVLGRSGISLIKSFLSDKQAGKMVQKAAETGLEKIGYQEIARVVSAVSELPYREQEFAFLQNKFFSFLAQSDTQALQKVVAKNLQKYTDQEIVSLVEEFMGKELQPITWFGALLGMLAGVGVAFFTPAPDLSHLSIYPVNLLAYGAVGYLTNVIALWMIFRPYKEIRWMAKLPFLRLFSKGYIGRNLKRFSQAMGVFVDRSLLDRKGLQALYMQQQKDWIYKTYENFRPQEIAQWTTKAAMGILSNASILTAKIQKLILRKAPKTLQRFFDTSPFQKISTRFKNQTIDLLVDQTLCHLTKKAPVWIPRLPALVKKPYIEQSKEWVLEVSSHQITKMAWQEAYEQIDYARTLPSLSDKILFNACQSNKGIRDFLTPIHAERLTDSILNSLVSYGSSDTFVHKISTWLYEFSSNKLSQKTNLIEWIPKQTLEKLPDVAKKVTLWLFERLGQTATAQQEKIYEELKRAIHQNLNFFLYAGYQAMNGDEILKDSLSHLLEEKLPAYLQTQEIAVQRILLDVCKEASVKIEPRHIQNLIEPSALQGVFKEILQREDFQNAVKPYLRLALNKNIERVRNISFSEVGHILEKILSRQALDLIDQHGIKMLDQLQENLYQTRGQLMEITRPFVEHSLQGAWEETAFTALKNLSASSAWQNRLSLSIQSLLQEDSFRHTAQELLDLLWSHGETRLRTGIQKDSRWPQVLLEEVQEVLANPQGIELLYQLIQEIAKYLQDPNNAAGLWGYEWGSTLIEPAINTLKNHLQEILNYAEIQEKAQRQILQMQPYQIHQLFLSFAGDYFHKLELYGWMGAVFGIHPLFGPAAFTITLLKKNLDIPINKNP